MAYSTGACVEAGDVTIPVMIMSCAKLCSVAACMHSGMHEMCTMLKSLVVPQLPTQNTDMDIEHSCGCSVDSALLHFY